MQNILAMIPARSGSKSVKHKNIRLINKKPLLAYSIEHAQKSKLVNRIIVSTDNAKYARIANKYGAETPFLRPREISGDFSTDLEVFTHALAWLSMNENYIPEFCVHLRPTYPIRDPNVIDSIIKIISANNQIDSIRTIILSPHTPYKMWFRDVNGFLLPVINTDTKEAFNLPRQALPKIYLQNACIDVIRTNVILECKSMTGNRIYGHVMDDFWDIDDLSQLKMARKYLKGQSK